MSVELHFSVSCEYCNTFIAKDVQKFDGFIKRHIAKTGHTYFTVRGQ